MPRADQALPGGLPVLLAPDVPAGKPVSLAPDILASLTQALRRPTGFTSYEALRQWVHQTHGVKAKCTTLNALVRVRFKADITSLYTECINGFYELWIAGEGWVWQ